MVSVVAGLCTCVVWGCGGVGEWVVVCCVYVVCVGVTEVHWCVCADNTPEP